MTEHEVTAVEPLYMIQKYAPDEEGKAQEIAPREEKGIVSDRMETATYECSCGEPLYDWSDVEDHFEEVVP